MLRKRCSTLNRGPGLYPTRAEVTTINDLVFKALSGEVRFFTANGTVDTKNCAVVQVLELKLQEPVMVIQSIKGIPKHSRGLVVGFTKVGVKVDFDGKVHIVRPVKIQSSECTQLPIIKASNLTIHRSSCLFNAYLRIRLII